MSDASLMSIESRTVDSIMSYAANLNDLVQPPVHSLMSVPEVMSRSNLDDRVKHNGGAMTVGE
eukprot:2712120-Rhodomonas_salina.1